MAISSPGTFSAIEEIRLPLADITGTPFEASGSTQIVLPEKFIPEQDQEVRIQYVPVFTFDDPDLVGYDLAGEFRVTLQDKDGNKLDIEPLNDYTIIINYDGYSSTGVNFEEVELFHLNQDTNSWEFVPRSKNYVDKTTVVAQTKKFGKFALADRNF